MFSQENTPHVKRARMKQQLVNMVVLWSITFIAVATFIYFATLPANGGV